MNTANTDQQLRRMLKERSSTPCSEPFVADVMRRLPRRRSMFALALGYVGMAAGWALVPLLAWLYRSELLAAVEAAYNSAGWSSIASLAPFAGIAALAAALCWLTIDTVSATIERREYEVIMQLLEKKVRKKY